MMSGISEEVFDTGGGAELTAPPLAAAVVGFAEGALLCATFTSDEHAAAYSSAMQTCTRNPVALACANLSLKLAACLIAFPVQQPAESELG
jgi:hypothetical protein